VAGFDNNNEDAIDRLIKVRDNIPMQIDVNSVVYALLNQLNSQMYGAKNLMQTFDLYYILNDQRLQLYLQQFRDIDVQNRNTYTLEDGLYFGRK
jgi:hypothetical protein